MITGGGKCGKLIEWNQDYQKTGRSLQIPESNGMCRVIQNGKGNNLFLIGTTKNCIFQANFDLNYLNLINIGHDQELWGLASNPRESHFLTCGNDKNLFYWDSLSHSQISSHQFEQDALHCVNIHPKLDLAAIGVSNKPKWFVYDLNERKIVYSQIEGTEQIQCISFSPNGLYLAVGSRDNFIYIYSVNETALKYSRIGRCTGHSSFILHLDWSIDSDYLMSNSGDYEILTWQAHNCKQITDVKLIRDLIFKTNTCTLSLNTMGIWTNSSSISSSNNSKLACMDGTDINACASSISNELCCSVDDFGKVNLFQYPCNLLKAEKRTYNGHSSHVTNVTFINNDTRIITTGNFNFNH
jgi:echinoderm microtubule-associated protein-like 1/2